MKIVFFGDSVTEGCFELYDIPGGGFDTVRDHEAVYHNRLKKLWKDKYNEELYVINSGISGDNVNGAVKRLDKDVLNHAPDMVVICFGLNDACGGKQNLDNYINTLDIIFTKIQQKNIRVVFMTPNMMNTYVDEGTLESAKSTALVTAEIQNTGVFNLYIGSVKELCRKKNITVADVYTKWKDMYNSGVNTTKLLSNLINHPDREMHNLFAETLIEVI